MPILLLITPLFIGPNNQAAAAVCPNVSPCFCYGAGNIQRVSVTCDKIPIDEVKAVFEKTVPFEMEIFTLIIPSSATAFIPSAIIGSNKVMQLKIQGDDTLNPFYTAVDIDPNAFSGAESLLGGLSMYYLDLSRFNFNFLNGFGGFYELRIEKSTNLESILTLPELYALRNIFIIATTGLKETFQSPINPADSLKCNGLNFLRVEDSLLDRNSMSNLLEWVLPSSRSTLVSLYFGSNEIETFPNQVSSFEKLQDIYTQYNRVNMTMGTNSMNITYQGRDCYLQMVSTGIVSIESGAFQGNIQYFYV